MNPYYVVQGYNFKSNEGFRIFEGEDKNIATVKAKEFANKDTITYIIDQFGNCVGKYGHGD